jgi:hypothetical protein
MANANLSLATGIRPATSKISRNGRQPERGECPDRWRDRVSRSIRSLTIQRVDVPTRAAKIVEIPLHFLFQGQEREDIVRFTDINNEGELIGNNYVSDGFLIDLKNHKELSFKKKHKGLGFFINKNHEVMEV